ncbi:hypothetical protein Tco_0526826 [Tanacetum coccineum]
MVRGVGAVGECGGGCLGVKGVERCCEGLVEGAGGRLGFGMCSDGGVWGGRPWVGAWESGGVSGELLGGCSRMSIKAAGDDVSKIFRILNEVPIANEDCWLILRTLATG